MVEHYRSDFNITDIVHIKKKEKKVLQIRKWHSSRY